MDNIKKVLLSMVILSVFSIGIFTIAGTSGTTTVSGTWEVQVTDNAIKHFQNKMQEEGLDKDQLASRYLQETIEKEYTDHMDGWFESALGKIDTNRQKAVEIIQSCTDINITEITHQFQNVCSNKTIYTELGSYTAEECVLTAVQLNLSHKEDMDLIKHKLTARWDSLSILQKDSFKECAGG